MKWDPERTNTLILASQAGNSDARELIMEENEPLVKALVRRFLNRGVDYDDLFQIGRIGLLKAIRGFDPAYNVRFSTYAVPMILGELKRTVRDAGPVSMPRSLKEQQQKLRLAHQRLCVTLGREPGTEELAEALGCPVEDVLFCLESMNPCASLDEPAFDESEQSLADMIEAPAKTVSLLDSMALKQCLAQLEEREQKILLLRYYKNYTQTRVAGILHLSQVQISRLEARALKKMRAKMK